MKSYLFIFVFLFFASHELLAEEVLPKGLLQNCRNGAFPSYKVDFKWATVKPEKVGKVQLLRDWDDCLNSSKGEVPCKYKTLPSKLSKLLVGPTLGDWVCIYYDESADWSKAENFVVHEAKSSAEPKDWVGKWSDISSEIEIKLKPDGKSLDVTGLATWQGGEDRDGYPIVHTGELGDIGKLKGNSLIVGKEEDVFAEVTNASDCAAKLTLVGEFLLVQDNSMCGGVNVRFNGVYSKG